MSTDGLDNGQIIKPNFSGFKDKQKLIEALIKKGNGPDCDTDFKQNYNTKKTSNVFRKISFTSKLDKDLQNKIAKGDLDMKGINLLKYYDHSKPKVDSIVPNGNTNKRKISNILPKLSPLVPALRLSHSALSDKLKRNESSSQISERNSTDAPTRRKSDETPSREMGKELIKELKQTNLIDKKALVPPPKRKTLPEIDLTKLKSRAELHKEPNSVVADKEFVDVKSKPVILPKRQQSLTKKGPIKPSQIYTIRHTDHVDSSNDSGSSPPKPDGDQAPAFPPVRPPRRRSSGSPRKKNKAPLPPADTETSPCSSKETGQTIYSEPSTYSEPILEVSRSSGELSQLESSSTASSSPSPISSSSSCNVLEADNDFNIELPKPLSKAGLPNGPPPQKPPRTFAYEIYNNSKVRRLSKSSFESLTQISPESLEKDSSSSSKSISDSSSPAPIYAIVNKKKELQSRPCPPADVLKPTIAPKPAHIKSLANNKRLSLVESSTPTDLKSENNADEEEEIHKQAHLRFSLRRAGRDPPDSPPPEPPSNPKPASDFQSYATPAAASKSGRNEDSANPLSLQCWQSDDFTLLKEGSLNRQKSMSDETLASSSGYQRIRGAANEPIYATPDLRGTGRRIRAGSGGELHYMCSDLFGGGGSNSSVLSPSGVSGGVCDSRKLGSRSNIIAAWKQEFRQSCRQVQHRLKKTVNR